MELTRKKIKGSIVWTMPDGTPLVRETKSGKIWQRSVREFTKANAAQPYASITGKVVKVDGETMHVGRFWRHKSRYARIVQGEKYSLLIAGRNSVSLYSCRKMDKIATFTKRGWSPSNAGTLAIHEPIRHKRDRLVIDKVSTELLEKTILAIAIHRMQPEPKVRRQSTTRHTGARSDSSDSNRNNNAWTMFSLNMTSISTNFAAMDMSSSAATGACTSGASMSFSGC